MLCLPLFFSKKCIRNKNIRFAFLLACEQALGAFRAAGREKEGQLATTYNSLEFEYLHRKSRCEMLIGRDDISNDVITLGTCFSIFVYISVRFRFALIGGNLTAQSTGATGNWRWNLNFRGVVEGLLPFPAPPPERPESLLAGYFSVISRKIDFIRTYYKSSKKRSKLSLYGSTELGTKINTARKHQFLLFISTVWYTSRSCVCLNFFGF